MATVENERIIEIFSTMDSQIQNTSLQRLQNVEKRIITVLELTGGVMEELANPSGPRKDLINNHCSEFMQLIKDIQVTLREEIKSASMKKLYRKNTVHPSPPLVSDKLAFLPAAILAITAALSPEDQEALAYLISCPSGNFSATRKTTSSSSSFSGHPPSFNCYCFNCYMSFWVRWDSSPNRQLIHQVIDAYEDGLQSKKEKSRRERRKANKDCGSGSGNELKKPEVALNGEDESGESAPAEENQESPISTTRGEEEDGYGEERGAVRRFVSFLGERIWGVWA
nr:neurogenic protein mastermind [Ipomoea batatas]